MSTFIIDTRTNCISVRAAVQDSPDTAKAEQFCDAAELATLAASWPMARLVEIWNNLPGARPVARFTDRKIAVARIWKALERLEEALPRETASAPHAIFMGPPERTQLPIVAHPETPAAKKGSRETAASVAGRTMKEDTQNKASKKVQVVALLRRPQGATLRELMAATGWQAHSVRGFLSGTLGKKMGLFVVSGKAESGERTYSIEA